MYARDSICNSRIFLGPADLFDAGNFAIVNMPWDLLPMATYDPALCLGGNQVQEPDALDFSQQVQAPGALGFSQKMPQTALLPVPNHAGQPPVVTSTCHATTTTSSNDDTPTKKRRVMKRSVDGREKD